MALLATRTTRPSCPSCRVTQHIRHASLIRRPKRPYTFTQLITLSDGSTFTQRTTSPQPIYRTTKDTRNSMLWNPSSEKLLNVEQDEAGRLKRFRKRFGRGFDVDGLGDEDGDMERAREREDAVSETNQQDESLLDLISGYGQDRGEAAGVRGEAVKSGKGKGGEK